MRPGSPGFVGARLTEAREARGLSIAQVAELSNVTRQAVSQYEKNRTTPSPDVALRLAQSLEMPLSFFWLPPVEEEGSAIFFRSLAAATKADRAMARRRLAWLKRIAFYLHEYVDLPNLSIPVIDVPSTLTAISDDRIEEAATMARRHWGLGDGPISNMVWLLENNGAVTARSALDAESLDGLSSWLEGDSRPYIFLGSDKGVAVRSRYDVAHELGHIVLHRHITKTEANVPSNHRLMEDQAHRFASAFLLPATAFARELVTPTLDAMRMMKEKWQTSVGTMILRAKAIDLIGEDQMRALLISRTRRGWRQHEPLDDVLRPEQTRVLQRSFQMLVDARVKTPEQIQQELSLHPSDITELANLPPDFFGDIPPNVRLASRYKQNNSNLSNTPLRIVTLA